MGVIDELQRDGIEVPLRMAASSGTLRLTDSMTLNAIDVGSLLYGLEPPGPERIDLGLRPALIGITSRLTQVRPRERAEFTDLVADPDRPIDDAGRRAVRRDRRLPRPVGRPRARPRPAGAGARHLARARPARPVRASTRETGDEVVIIGRQGDAEITMRDVATANGLYSPAVVPVLVGRAVPRRYTD